MQKLSIACDHCGQDLTNTWNCVDYRLSLGLETINPRDGAVTLMNIEPPLKAPAHFCGLSCLRQWAVRVAPLAGENNVVQLQHNNGGSDESK